MATPSSSATSPSPPMAYLHQVPPQPQSTLSAPMDPQEREHRKKAVQKFLARAEISMVTRGLRARLSYASYKATHNIPHVPLRDLEAQTQAQTASFSRTIAAKRKAAGTNNYYNNPATQGNNATSAGTASLRRGGSGTMAPPSSSSLAPRSHYPSVNGSGTSSNNRSTGAAQSLYTSILAPPPAKQARTIHNASDPPLLPSSRPAASPRARGSSVKGAASARSIAEGTRAQAKSRRDDSKNTGATPAKGKRAAGTKGKQKQKRGAGNDVDADGDVDMKAAATLTSLLLHHRPSIAGSASSPRSSIDGSETGSTQSYSLFAQSSARTLTSAPTSTSTSTTTTAEPSFRNNTPPPTNPTTNTNAHTGLHTTPRPAPTDNEAADLMLFLATSPSPARPSNKDSKDLAAYRALGGGPASSGLRAKGRVLFPTAGGEEGTSGMRGPGLTRGGPGESSFASSISSIGSEMGVRGGSGMATPTPTPAQLLPPPPLPMSSPSSTHKTSSPTSTSTPSQLQNPYPVPADFNFSDFIHASPSPSRGSTNTSAVLGISQNRSLGLRADVGRKLFEEEQTRLGLGGSTKRMSLPGVGEEERALGAGIDLVQS